MTDRLTCTKNLLYFTVRYYVPAPNRRGHKAMMLSDVCLTSDVCLSDVSVAYIGPKSRTERPTKTKIGTVVAHVTRDSDTTFKVKRSKVKVTRPLCSSPCWRVRRLQRWAWERVGRGKLLLCCRLLGGARRFVAHGGGEGRGISWRPPAYSLFVLLSDFIDSSYIMVSELRFELIENI